MYRVNLIIEDIDVANTRVFGRVYQNNAVIDTFYVDYNKIKMLVSSWNVHIWGNGASSLSTMIVMDDYMSIVEL